MKKRLDEIFDGIRPEELDQFTDALNAPALSPDSLSAVKDKVYGKIGTKTKKSTPAWIRFGAIAACLPLIIGAILIQNREIFEPYDPITNVQISSPAPQYAGNNIVIPAPGAVTGEMDTTGLSVTARLIEVLPDTYTLLDDWYQREYRILRMETVKVLYGQEMAEEFYFLVAARYMTDFSIFDRFVLRDMWQYGYEYSVLYNKSQGAAEQLTLVLFGFFADSYTPQDLMAFNALGLQDQRLWTANEAWIEAKEHFSAPASLLAAETALLFTEDRHHYTYSSLKDVTGDAAATLEEIKDLSKGVFIHGGSPFLSSSSGVYYHGVRYINGFATNEGVCTWSEVSNGETVYRSSRTTARFSDHDLENLPDLAGTFSAVTEELSNGSIAPPHFNNDLEISRVNTGVFAWYAKTENGVIGVIRISWHFDAKLSYYYDDAYYIIESGSAEYTPIDRDALLEKLGDCETTYICTGTYSEYGILITIINLW